MRTWWWALLHALHSLLAATLQHLLALLRRSVVPLVVQRLALLGGELLEPPVVLAHRILLVRR